MSQGNGHSEVKIHASDKLPEVKANQEKPKMIAYFDLFRFARKEDIALMVLGSIAAFVNGGAIPSFSLIFGSMINSF